MKRKLLVALVVLAASGFLVWSQRFELALNHVRGQGGSGDDGLTSIAWSILGEFADRPEVEAVVREQLVATAATALGTDVLSGAERVPLLDASRQVYEHQPARVDAAVVAAGLVVECLRGCLSDSYVERPVFRTDNWPSQVKESDSFRTGMRQAAIELATHRPENSSAYPTRSYVGLASALAEHVATPDPELARSVASFIVAANPGEREAEWLTAALDRIGGPGNSGAAWAAALAEAPAVGLNAWIWTGAVDALRRSPAPREEPLVDAVIAQCVRRSDPSGSVDDECIDLGLAWGVAWTSRLRAAVARDSSDADGVRALLAAHERERVRTWHDVIAEWREAEPSPPGATVSPSGKRMSAMEAFAVAASPEQRTLIKWLEDEPSLLGEVGKRLSEKSYAYQAPLSRRHVKDVALLLATGGPAFAAVEAQYRDSRNQDVIAVAALVLSKGSPQMLSSATMHVIERFRPLAFSFVRDRTFDAAGYSLEGRRVALGLLRLNEIGNGSPRIHPLIFALSIPDPSFSEYASAELRRTLTGSQFADALFGFLAVRNRYLLSEVDAYQRALTSYEDVGPAIEDNLARLLAAARGRPERVAWILKVIGISALGEVGGSSARPLLEKYAADTGTYLQGTVAEDDPLAPETETTEQMQQMKVRRFDALVSSALEQIADREGA